jgi:NifU-like protein involved in Fe-S cluster formation
MNTTSSTLYTREILRLATALPYDDKLASPDGTATCRAPLCGSEVTAQVMRDANGTIAAIAFRARACALGQASAALLREHGEGLSLAELGEVRQALAEYLGGGDGAALPWTALEAFEAAKAHNARHGAILLPYDALIAAIQDAA